MIKWLRLNSQNTSLDPDYIPGFLVARWAGLWPLCEFLVLSRPGLERAAGMWQLGKDACWNGCETVLKMQKEMWSNLTSHLAHSSMYHSLKEVWKGNAVCTNTHITYDASTSCKPQWILYLAFAAAGYKKKPYRGERSIHLQVSWFMNRFPGWDGWD